MAQEKKVGFPASWYATPPILYPIPIIKLQGIPSENPANKTYIGYPFVFIT